MRNCLADFCGRAVFVESGGWERNVFFYGTRTNAGRQWVCLVSWTACCHSAADWWGVGVWCLAVSQEYASERLAVGHRHDTLPAGGLETSCPVDHASVREAISAV